MDIKEVRVYFECLEQANHYVKPSIENVWKKLGSDQMPPIKLIKLRKRPDLYSTKIQKILEWKNPDILVSIVTNTGVEVPVFIVEFSTAVFTEDHELQRFDGMVTAAENNVVFVKISPVSKRSEARHGGKTDFDYRVPFALIYKKYGIIHFHIDWKSRGSIVEVHEEYLSCPKESTDFEKILEVIFNSFSTDRNRVDLKKLKENTEKLYKWWLKELKNVSIKSVFDRLKLNTSRLRLLDDHHTVEVKINRFGHAMDPERGMLVFYSVLFDGNVISKMVFHENSDAWYKGVPKEKEIRDFIKKSGLQTAEDFLYVFYLGSGLYRITSFEKFRNNIVEGDNVVVELDLSGFINNFWNSLSKPLKTIFRFSKQLYIEDRMGVQRVIFKWDKNITSQIHYKEKEMTYLQSLKEIDEDIVTYVIIHNVLRPQGYKILAASYPGAQGDRVILIMAGSGRRQPRKYVDVIAFSIERNVSTLQSNKGKFSVKTINKEIRELKKYKHNRKYINGLKSFFERFEANAINSTVKIGVGFWLNKKYKSDALKTINLEDLDYFFFITEDMEKWLICRIGNIELLNNYEGNVNIPSICEPTEERGASSGKECQ